MLERRTVLRALLSGGVLAATLGCQTVGRDPDLTGLALDGVSPDAPDDIASWYGLWTGSWDNRWPMAVAVTRIAPSASGSFIADATYFWSNTAGGRPTLSTEAFGIVLSPERLEYREVSITRDVGARTANVVGRFAARRTARVTWSPFPETQG